MVLQLYQTPTCDNLICVKCYDNNKISIVSGNNCPICSNNKYFFRKENIMATENKDIMTIPRGDIVSRNVIRAIAARLEMTYIPPGSGERIINDTENDGKNEFCTVVELALAMGYHPLAPGFHYWKQKGQIRVDSHYTTLLRWVEKIDPVRLNFETKTIKEGDGAGWECTCFLLRKSDREEYHKAYREMLKLLIEAKVNAEEAMKLTKGELAPRFMSKATSFVSRDEVYSFDKKEKKEKLKFGSTPRGWVPGITRAEVRAARAAIKKAFGLPTPSEIRDLMFEELGIPQKQALQFAVEMPDEMAGQPPYIQEKYLKLQAETEKHTQEMASLSPEERHRQAQETRDIMYPVHEDGIGDDKEEDEVQIPKDIMLLLGECNIQSNNYSRLLTALFELKSFNDLSDVQWVNLGEYLKRLKILKGYGNLDEKIAQIPELDSNHASINAAAAVLRLKFIELLGDGTTIKPLEISNDS